MEIAIQNMTQKIANLKSKVSGLEEQLEKLKKFLGENKLVGKLKEFLKNLESKSMETEQKNQLYFPGICI